MELVLVDSRAIKAVGFDPTTSMLTVQFHDDDVYHHPGVPPDVYADLLQAESIGKFYYTKVRRAYPGKLAEGTRDKSR